MWTKILQNMKSFGNVLVSDWNNILESCKSLFDHLIYYFGIYLGKTACESEYIQSIINSLKEGINDGKTLSLHMSTMPTIVPEMD